MSREIGRYGQPKENNNPNRPYGNHALVTVAEPSKGIFLPFDRDEHQGWTITKNKMDLLWDIQPQEGEPLPAKLSGRWTDLVQARKAITSHMAETGQTKEGK